MRPISRPTATPWAASTTSGSCRRPREARPSAGASATRRAAHFCPGSTRSIFISTANISRRRISRTGRHLAALSGFARQRVGRDRRRQHRRDRRSDARHRTYRRTGRRDQHPDGVAPAAATQRLPARRDGDSSGRLRATPIEGFVRGNHVEFQVPYGAKTFYFEGRRTPISSTAPSIRRPPASAVLEDRHQLSLAAERNRARRSSVIQ